MEPVQGALDQIVQRFGTDMVAEVTGRSRRIVRKVDADGDRLAVENRPAHANLAEAQAFMEDRKQILVFSDAGGTGTQLPCRSGREEPAAPASLSAGSRLEGRCRDPGPGPHQPHQSGAAAAVPAGGHQCPGRETLPLNNRAAARHSGCDHARTAQTGGQGLFRPEDNLESPYARDALRQLYVLIYAGKVEQCSLATFESMTGLSLTDGSGCLKDELPPITTFLNRLLALTIAMQNVLFTVFEQLLERQGRERNRSGQLTISGWKRSPQTASPSRSSEPIYVHPATGAETRLLTIAMQRTQSAGVARAGARTWRREPGARLLVNARSKRAAVQLPARSVMLDDGEVERRIRLIRPMERLNFALNHLAETSWEAVDEATFAATWQTELAQVDEFTQSELHIVTGLLLPIWKQLPEESTRVYRLQTDDGTRIVGRRVSPAWAASATARTGRPGTVSPPQALALLREGQTILDLADGAATAPFAADAGEPDRTHRVRIDGGGPAEGHGAVSPRSSAGNCVCSCPTTMS